jgi:hypothetical protein
MLRMAKSELDLKLTDDPKTIRDPVRWNRLRVMAYEKAVDPAWTCPLYRAAEPGGWLTKEHLEAGDKYQQLTIEHGQLQGIDPDEAIPEGREFLYRRIKNTKEKWRECVRLLGMGRRVVDDFVLEELAVTTVKEKRIVKDGLQLLANLFNTGRTKRVQNV